MTLNVFLDFHTEITIISLMRIYGAFFLLPGNGNGTTNGALLTSTCQHFYHYFRHAHCLEVRVGIKYYVGFLESSLRPFGCELLSTRSKEIFLYISFCAIVHSSHAFLVDTLHQPCDQAEWI